MVGLGNKGLKGNFGFNFFNLWKFHHLGGA